MDKIDISFCALALFHLLTASAALGLAYNLIVIVLVAIVPRDDPSPPPASRSVTVLRPLHGAEPRLQTRLAALGEQAYPGPVQVVFGCQDCRDPAAAIVESLQIQRPDLDVQLVVDDRCYGSNRKISNLINMYSVARHELVAISDSDIEVDRCYLARVTAPLERQEVGAVTCLYHGVPGKALASHLSALAINVHFLPNVIVATAVKLAEPCFGSTIAMRRETLERIGGLGSFVDKLADDFAIGQAVRAAGLEVEVSKYSLGHACTEETVFEFLCHELRHARTIRSLDPFGYAGAFVSNPLPLALLGALQGGGSALALMGFVLAARMALCKTIEYKFETPKQRLWLVPPADILIFAVYVCSFFGSTITWRGRRYRFVSDGTLFQDVS